MIKVGKKITQKEYLKKAAYKNSIWDFVGNYYRLYLGKGDHVEKKLQDFILLLKWDGTSDESVDTETLFQIDQYRQASEAVFPVIEKIIGNLVTENLDETVFYEKLIKVSLSDDLEHLSVIGSIMWFPPEFTGYTNFNTQDHWEGQGKGIVSGKIVIDYDLYYWEHPTQFYRDKIFPGASREDLENAMMALLVDLESKDFVFIDK